jgi:DNA-binding MarR family transcriptional regulator
MALEVGVDPGDDSARLYLAVIRLNRALRRDSREATVGHGGLSALATLIADGPQRAGALAQAEGITAPAMTRILNYLESLSYVVRTSDPADGRAQLVAATDAGRALVAEGRSARLQALQERFGRLPGSSQRSIVDALGALEALTEGSNAG